MTDLEAVREKFIAERPIYAGLAKFVEDLVHTEAYQVGIACFCDSRAKEVHSFVKKVVLKTIIQSKNTSPYEQTPDKAGARIVVTYESDVAIIEEIINRLFDVQKHEKKQLGHAELGYLGSHFEVRIPDSRLQPEQQSFQGKICEIQIHTHAQSLWAKVSHELLYKPAQAPPEQIQRLVYRLVALLEIFDSEILSARQAVLNLPRFQEAGMLEHLEKHFYQLTARTFDKELSLEILGSLVPVLTSAEMNGFNTQIDAFVAQNTSKLTTIFRKYSQDDRCSPLLFQPESLLIFELLEAKPFLLKDIWCKVFPLVLLEELATVWGKQI